MAAYIAYILYILSNLNIIANLNNKNKLCWLKSYEIDRYQTIINCPLTPRFPKKIILKDKIGNIIKNIIYWNIMAVRIKTQYYKIVIATLDSVVLAIVFLIQSKLWPLIDFGPKN